jgi:hypothetical protein
VTRFYLRMICPCGANFEGWVEPKRIMRVNRAFRLAHHHPRKRDALGRFVAWTPE